MIYIKQISDETEIVDKDYDVIYYNETDDKLTFKEAQSSPSYEYVDLGLSVKWATCNVGANSPEEYGLFFQWGATEGYADGSHSSESTVPYYDGTYTKYNEADGKTVLGPEDDAAHVNMGGNWRMPTEAELKELTANTTSEWTTLNGVNGIKYTSTKVGCTDKYIFIPAAGNANSGSVGSQGSYGSIWSSSRYNVSNGWLLYFSSSYQDVNNSSRYYGRSVRGVLD